MTAARGTAAPAWVAVLIVFALSASAAINEDEAASRHVGVNVYLGSELVRTATGIVVGPGTVLADAETLTRGRRHTVMSTGGAEVAASVSHSDRSLGLAVLNVPGLDQPALSFALAEVGKDEDRFVHVASFDATATGTPPFVFRAGSISASDEAVARASGDSIAVYRHNALIASPGFGGALMNNCGELIGINRPDPGAGGLFSDALDHPESVVFALRLSAIEQRLGEWDVEYLKSADPCLSEADSAAAAAAQKAAEAEQANVALEEAKRLEQELRTAAETAREAGEAARAEAEAERKAAEEAVVAAETAAEAAKEDAEAARQAAIAESERLNKALSEAAEENERAQRRSRTITASALTAAAVLGALVFVLWLRNRRKNRLVALATAETEAAQRELAQASSGALPDLMLEGADDEGTNFALKIPGASLRAGVDGLVVGRSPDRATFVLDHPSVSRAHCRLRLVDGILHVEDLRATNGVLLNDDALLPEESRPVRAGDRLTLGTVELTVRFL